MPATTDYRTSHLDRGEHYDCVLAGRPFDAYMAAWETRHLVSILQDLFDRPPERYLDFACGTGRVTSIVAPRCGQAMGIDVSRSMIAVARGKLPQVDFRLADLAREDPDLGAFDLITAFRFFGNAEPELREEVLSALVKRLAPRGKLIINSHRNPHALHAVLERLTGGDAGRMDLHLGRLRRLLARHRLKIRRLQPIGAWMFRARLLQAHGPDEPRAVANEHRFGHPWLAAVAPDVIVVAEHA